MVVFKEGYRDGDYEHTITIDDTVPSKNLEKEQYLDFNINSKTFTKLDENYQLFLNLYQKKGRRDRPVDSKKLLQYDSEKTHLTIGTESFTLLSSNSATFKDKEKGIEDYISAYFKDKNYKFRDPIEKKVNELYFFLIKNRNKLKNLGEEIYKGAKDDEYIDPIVCASEAITNSNTYRTIEQYLQEIETLVGNYNGQQESEEKQTAVRGKGKKQNTAEVKKNKIEKIEVSPGIILDSRLVEKYSKDIPYIQ